MRGYPVYILDISTGRATRVGSILEFRRSRRSMNRICLARLAQKLFASGPSDIVLVGEGGVAPSRKASPEPLKAGAG